MYMVSLLMVTVIASRYTVLEMLETPLSLSLSIEAAAGQRSLLAEVQACDMLGERSQ